MKKKDPQRYDKFYNWLCDYVVSFNRFPPIRAILACGLWKSTSTIAYALEVLVQEGRIQRNETIVGRTKSVYYTITGQRTVIPDVCYVIRNGNDTDGYEMIGPFPSFDEAAVYAEKNRLGCDWIASVQVPK